MEGDSTIEKTDEDQNSSNQVTILLVYGNQTGWERLVVNSIMNYLKGMEMVSVVLQDLNSFQTSQLGDVAICIIVISVLPFGKPLGREFRLEVMYSIIQKV